MELPSPASKRAAYYNDCTIRIIAAISGSHIITEYVSLEPWSSHLFDKSYLIEFGSTLLIMLLIVNLIYQATVFLDRRYDWYDQTLLRVILQILLGIIVPGIVVFMLAASYLKMYGNNIFAYNYRFYVFPFIIALISIFNGYYLVRYLVWRCNQLLHLIQTTPVDAGIDIIVPALEEEKSEGPVPKKIFIAHTPTGSIPVPVDSIAYFYRTSGRVFIRTFEGSDRILSQSLNQIEEYLDKNIFFRAARNMIVNHKAIMKYYPLNYGKVGIGLNPGFKEEINVSKLQAKTFKQWFDR